MCHKLSAEIFKYVKYLYIWEVKFLLIYYYYYHHYYLSEIYIIIPLNKQNVNDDWKWEEFGNT